MNVILTILLFLVAISNADNCQHWSVCNQNSDPIDPLDPLNPVKRGKMGPKGEKGSPGPDMSNEIRNLEEITKVFVAEMSIFNETLSTQRDKIYLLEQEKGFCLIYIKLKLSLCKLRKCNIFCNKNFNKNF